MISHHHRPSSRVVRLCASTHGENKVKHLSLSTKNAIFLRNLDTPVLHDRCPTIHPNGTEWNHPVQLTHWNSELLFTEFVCLAYFITRSVCNRFMQLSWTIKMNFVPSFLNCTVIFWMLLWTLCHFTSWSTNIFLSKNHHLNWKRKFSKRCVLMQQKQLTHNVVNSIALESSIKKNLELLRYSTFPWH